MADAFRDSSYSRSVECRRSRSAAVGREHAEDHQQGVQVRSAVRQTTQQIGSVIRLRDCRAAARARFGAAQRLRLPLPISLNSGGQAVPERVCGVECA